MTKVYQFQCMRCFMLSGNVSRSMQDAPTCCDDELMDAIEMQPWGGPAMRSPFEETVRGTIIGEITWPYEFWTIDGQHQIAKRHFENDREAVAWFKKHHSAAYPQGADMRCFDQEA